MQGLNMASRTIPLVMEQTIVKVKMLRIIIIIYESVMSIDWQDAEIVALTSIVGWGIIILKACD